MCKKIYLIALLTAAVFYANAQEIQAKVTILAQQIPTTIYKNRINTLQSQLTNMINNRKWTKDVFQTQEKIQCNFLLNVSSVSDDNVYKASLTIQAARPVYNATYQSPLVNFQDGDFTFKYVEYQPIEFNENRVGGTDPLAGNLTAVFAYYIYIILGLDYDSLEAKAGDQYFQKAQNIVNNAPESSEISGWKNYENQRNRYWLAENINNNRFALIHDAIYLYYRNGMDLLYENEEEARNGVLNCLNYLSTINKENPNSMIMQFFFQGRSNELVKIFSKAKKDVKDRALSHLLKLDVTNARIYNDLK